MPMELRKRKAPANPPPPAPAKKSKTAEAKKKVVAKAKEVKEAVAPAKKPAAKKKAEKATVEKKDAAPAPAPVEEKAPEPETKAPEPPKPEAAAPAPAEPTASASTAAAPAKTGRGKAAAAAVPAKTGRAKAAAAPKETKEDAKADSKAKADAVPKLKVGDTLPTDLAELTLDDGTKTTFGALLDASEKGIVLFSYSKAGTAGCNTQACAFRDAYSQFKDAGYLVYGISVDTPADNAKWKTKQNLGFPLLSDPSLVFHEKLGIKSTAAKPGSVRSVIVVQKEGKIIKEHKGVSTKTSLDVARKAVGIEAPAEEKKEKKEVTVGKEAPAAAGSAAAPATEEAKPAEAS